MGVNEGDGDTVQDRVIIGSAPTCDVRVTASKVSRRHCAVSKTPEGFLIEDLQSRNGTYVNGRRIDRRTAVAFGSQVTLSRSVAFPWDDVASFLKGQNDESPTLARAVTIGRLPGNDLVLDDRTVSGRHARVLYERSEVFIEDLGSRNGTFIVGDPAPIARALIRPGDVLMLGKCPLPARVFFESSATQQQNAVGGMDEPAKTELGDSPAVAHGSLNLTGREGVFVVGRSASADFQLDYPMVSLRHAQLRIDVGEVTITDLGSSNGTFVNGQRIRRPTRIVPGDVIALGSVWFVLSRDGRSLAPGAARGDITIEARGVGVSVPTGQRILESISLSIMPGELVGVMGPSGSGKSTLIAALNGYTPPTDGTVFINGQDLYGDYDTFRGMIGYVPQDDIMHSDLTVFEALYFTARLRLPTDYSDGEVRKRITKVLGELGLQGTEDTRIGNAERRGISGGQRKRVNVAMELLTDPPLLFLDEPTSGLSSEDAMSLMRLLRQLADGGKTVILTIHQPSLDVFRLMDNLIVVGKDNAPAAAGRLAYYGPAFPDAIAFFEPSSAAAASPDTVLRGLAARPVREWVSQYAGSSYHTRFVANRLQRRRKSTDRKLARRRPAGSRTQFMTLVRRGLAVKMKDSWNTGVLLLQAPLIAVLIGLVFGPKLAGDVTVETFPDVGRAVATTVFLLGVSALWFGCSNSARDIVAEAAIYRRERMVGLGIPSYLASKVTILAMLCAFQCGVLLIVVGWLGDLAASWLELYASLFMASLVGVAVGLTVSAAARTGEVAAGVLPLVILPMVILGGVLLPLHDLPRSPIPMNMAAATMPSRWAFEALLLPETKAREFLDSTASPPAVVSAAAASSHQGDSLTDMAEPFFRARDRWTLLRGFPFFVMQMQALGLVLLVGVLLKAKDTA